MVISCCAYGCTERFKKGSDVSFHSFPLDKKKRNIWTWALRRKDFEPSSHSKLCSKHFLPECFDKEAFGLGRKLKPDAVPTIFNFPPHLVRLLKKRKPPFQRTQDVDASVVRNAADDCELSLPAKRPRTFRNTYVGDFTEEIAKSPSKSLVFMETCKRKLFETKKKLRMTRQQLRRTLLKLTSAKALVKHLQQELTTKNASDTIEVIVEVVRK